MWSEYARRALVQFPDLFLECIPEEYVQEIESALKDKLARLRVMWAIDQEYEYARSDKDFNDKISALVSDAMKADASVRERISAMSVEEIVAI